VTSLRRSIPIAFSVHLVLALGAMLVLALGLTTATAAAVVTTLGSTKVGLQPRAAEFVFEGTPFVASFDNAEGNAVLHKNETYAIYWDPTDHYHGDWQHLIDTFLHGLGADSGSTDTVFAVDSQYTDRSNLPASYQSTFRGAYTDTEPYPAGNCTDPHPLEAVDLIGPVVAKKHTEVCLTDAQIRIELKAFIAAHGLQKGASSIFYLLTPPAVTICLDGGGPTGHCSDHTGSIEATGSESYKNSFCSYHADFSATTLENSAAPDANTILYGVVPWTAGGRGDYHLTQTDQTSAYDCQDGGFDPTSNPIEEKEHPKVSSQEEEAKRFSAEKKENEELTTFEEQFKKEVVTKAEFETKAEELKVKREKRQEEEAKAREQREAFEDPRQQEPNQAGLGPDGSYDTGLADLIVSQIGVQQQNIVTDPLLNAWRDSAGNESTDECRNFFAPAIGGSVSAVEKTFAGTLYNQSYAGANAYVNNAFNLAAGRLPFPGVGCMTNISLVPQFTAPNTVNTGELVGFDGMESNITLNDDIGYSKSGAEQAKYASYTWDFGDETPTVTGLAPGAPSVNSPGNSPCALPWEAPCAASTFHSYQYGGTYDVTLTVTDTGGNTASVTNQITVQGPPRPSNEQGSGGSGSGGGASSASSSTGGTSSGTGSSAPAGAKPFIAPNPVATAAIVSKSLASVVRGGLVVRYSVNEQVAGRFEVLLASSIAKRIGLHGAPATGLPKGTPTQIVIAKAILVTTKGGRNTIKIQFGKTTAARLRKLRKVSLMLRMIVRNASSQSPTSTTVLSTVNLGR
jgi:uncharacterized membrane protein YgcG